MASELVARGAVQSNNIPDTVAASLIVTTEGPDDVIAESDTTTRTCSAKVFIEGYGVHRIGDFNTEHQVGNSRHFTALSVGSLKVFADGIGVGREKDIYTCAGTISRPDQTKVFAA